MIRLLLGSVLGAVAFGADAQLPPLADPTRPPSVSAEGAAPGEPVGPQLQSILISPARRVAVINGQPVALGQKFGEATVVRISETAVVLKTAEGMETLKLYPAAEKKVAARGKGRGKSAEGAK